MHLSFNLASNHLFNLTIIKATGITDIGFAQGAAQGTELILVVIANLAIGALIIYRTWKLE
jgi:hypothetical protein